MPRRLFFAALLERFRNAVEQRQRSHVAAGSAMPPLGKPQLEAQGYLRQPGRGKAEQNENGEGDERKIAEARASNDKQCRR